MQPFGEEALSTGMEPAVGRIAALDVARLYGIVLVYYGHVIERLMYLGNPAAALQYKFIYSFHMPLFFVLAGCVARDWGATMTPAAFARSRLMSRIVPLLAFNALLAALSLVAPRDFPPVPLATAADYGNAAVGTLIGLPVFNIPTWFLMCLVSVEVVHYAVFRFLRASDVRIVAAIVGFYVAGYLLNREIELFAGGDFGRPSWWFMNEAIVVYAFYLLGVMIRRRNVLARPATPLAVTAVAAAAIALVALTYDLNTGPFRLIPAVVILVSGHGHMLWFPLTAAAGSIAVLALARLSPPAAWMIWMGRNALILFCLNGIVYHHLNGPLAQAFASAAPASGWVVLLYGVAVTAASLAVAAPLVLLLNRWVPQLVGRPSVEGPLMPRLL